MTRIVLRFSRHDDTIDVIAGGGAAGFHGRLIDDGHGSLAADGRTADDGERSWLTALRSMPSRAL